MSEARTRTPKLVSGVPDARALRLSSNDGFLLSCVDGLTSESDLALVTGHAQGEVRASLSRLESLGLITIEEVGANPQTTPSPSPTASSSVPDGGARAARRAMASAGILTPLPPSMSLVDDAAAMAEDVDIDVKLRQELLALSRRLDHLDHYALLGIGRDADKAATKRAYYELAAKFHPDRYFRKRLGTFKVRMESVFSRLTLALETLSVIEKRTEYDAYLDEQRRLRGIERLLAGTAAEVERARESVEREVRAEEPTPLAPPVAPRIASVRPAPHATPNSTPSPFASEMDPAARREAFARRLLGGRSGATLPPPVRASTPPAPYPAITTADAMAALRRRYEERIAVARSAEARRYADRAEEASRSNEVVTAASAFQVASGLAPDDDDLKRKAAKARAEAESMLGQTYRRQAVYEEKNSQWTEAARSWMGVCRVHPDDAEAHERAASAILNGRGDNQEALRLAARACQLSPTRAASRVTLGKVYLAAGQGPSAKRELETAASLDPHDDTIKELMKKIGKLA